MFYSRRKFLSLASIAAFSALHNTALASNATQLPMASSADLNRSLSLRNLHTGEKICVDYCENGRYQLDALTELNHFFRDHRSNSITTMDPALLDNIHDLIKDVEYQGEIHIISAYRSPETNEKLRQQGRNVSKRSFHMTGQAIDLRLPGKALKHVHAAALQHHEGGVGYYPRSDFLHLDTGRKRRWG